MKAGFPQSPAAGAGWSGRAAGAARRRAQASLPAAQAGPDGERQRGAPERPASRTKPEHQGKPSRCKSSTASAENMQDGTFSALRPQPAVRHRHFLYRRVILPRAVYQGGGAWAFVLFVPFPNKSLGIPQRVLRVSQGAGMKWRRRRQFPQFSVRRRHADARAPAGAPAPARSSRSCAAARAHTRRMSSEVDVARRVHHG